MNNNLLKALFDERGVVLFDAAMGTALQASGLRSGAGSEEMNIKMPDAVMRIHKENLEAGCDVVTSNTFGVTQKMMRGGREEALLLLKEGVRLAKQAAVCFSGPGLETQKAGEIAGLVEHFADGRGGRLACLGVGPAGALLGALGDMSYEAAGELYALQAEAGAGAGADFILLETFADLEEFTFAARAAKKASGLPVLGTMTFGESGRSFMGAAPKDAVLAARAEGLFAIGANCSLGPHDMIPVIREILEAAAGLPVIAQPNAGKPVYKDGNIEYEIKEDDFVSGAAELLALGVSAIGGCCGTTPKMISAVRGIIDARKKL